jgi:hypothetical protein
MRRRAEQAEAERDHALEDGSRERESLSFKIRDLKDEIEILQKKNHETARFAEKIMIQRNEAEVDLVRAQASEKKMHDQLDCQEVWLSRIDSLEGDLRDMRETNRHLRTRATDAESALETERTKNQILEERVKQLEGILEADNDR